MGNPENLLLELRDVLENGFLFIANTPPLNKAEIIYPYVCLVPNIWILYLRYILHGININSHCNVWFPMINDVFCALLSMLVIFMSRHS